MLAIFQAYIDIALLRRGPQTLPPSPALLLLTLLALALVASFPLPGDRFSVAQIVTFFSIDVLMLCSVIWLLLTAKGYVGRFVQTMTAVFGAELVILIIKVGVALVLGDAVVPPQPGEPVETPHMITFALEAWSLVVLSAILREALAIGVLQSVGIILMEMILFLGAASLVLPYMATNS
ncbi:MAG: hypothetical protein AB8G16_02375 [Gammaproteobacteria bacterium]